MHCNTYVENTRALSFARDPLPDVMCEQSLEKLSSNSGTAPTDADGLIKMHAKMHVGTNRFDASWRCVQRQDAPGQINMLLTMLIMNVRNEVCALVNVPEVP